MRRYFISWLAIITAMIAGIFICAIADDLHIKDDLQVNFDKMPYDDSRQKYYEVIVQSIWKALWKHDNGDSSGVYMKVAAGKRLYLVPVAPCWYFDSLNKFKADEKITVFGADSEINGRSIILPKLIKSSSGELWLRNYDGRPFWIITSKNGDLRRMNPDGGKGPGQGGPPGGGGGRPSF
jgi:hypothetical protein